MARVDSMVARVLALALLIITLSCTTVLSDEFTEADEDITGGYGEDPIKCEMKCGVKAFPCGLGCIPQGPVMVPCIVQCAIEAFKCLAACVAGSDPPPGPIPTPPILPPILPPLLPPLLPPKFPRML